MRRAGTQRGLQRRPVPGHRSGPSRSRRYLHDHEHAAVLDRPRRQELDRRPGQRLDLRRRRRSSALRCLDGRNRQRRQRVATYPVSTAVTLGETAVPAGYAATIDCGQGAQAYSGGPFAVSSPNEDGATLTCTITNRQLRSTVQVVKDWAGGASAATIFVDAGGTEPYDASTVATASGQSASFTYPVAMPVSLGEAAVPTGYTATIDCGGGPQSYGGGAFPVTAPAADGATLTCTITNTPQATVRVLKNWFGRPNSTTIFVDASGQAPFDVSTVAQADGESASFDYRPGTPVTVGEVSVPAGYRAAINCGTGPLSLRRYAGGPYLVTAPSTPNGVITCLVSNVRRLAQGRLVIVKTSSRRLVRAPRRFEFRFTVRNTGPGIVRSVRVCDKLPSGLVLVRAGGARLVRGELCWHITRLRPRARKNFRIVVRAKKTKRRVVIVNVAHVSGVNTGNCAPLATAGRAQGGRGCSDSARVTVLPARVLGQRAARPPFTG